jgi:vacuolar iron transporter family protein
MSLPPPSDHFRGKSVVDHLKEARTKGMQASHETHGTEMPGHYAAGADSAKETAIVFVILWVLSLFISFPVSLFVILSLFAFAWAIWKTGRSALLGWARMERLHRLIEEERWEIQHHRQQERKELGEMYRAKGFEGKLLEEVLDVLMSDDNRLLKVMLEEELGLTLEAYEHPLRQSLGALLGVICATALCLLGLFTFPPFGLPVCAALSISIATILSARIEKNRIFASLLWHLSIAALVAGASYFFSQMLL